MNLILAGLEPKALLGEAENKYFPLEFFFLLTVTFRLFKSYN